MKKRITKLMALVVIASFLLSNFAYAAEPTVAELTIVEPTTHEALAVVTAPTADDMPSAEQIVLLQADGDAGGSGSGNGPMDDPDSQSGGGNQDNGDDGGTGEQQTEDPSHQDNNDDNGHQDDQTSGDSDNNSGSQTDNGNKDENKDDAASDPNNEESRLENPDDDQSGKDDQNGDDQSDTPSDNDGQDDQSGTPSDDQADESGQDDQTSGGGEDRQPSDNQSGTPSDDQVPTVSINTVTSAGYVWNTTNKKGVAFSMWTPYWLMTMLKGSGWKIGKKKTQAVLTVPTTKKSFKIKKKLKTDDKAWSSSSNSICPDWMQTVCKNKLDWTILEKVDEAGDNYLEIYYAFAKSKKNLKKQKWAVAYKVVFYNYKHPKNAFEQIDGAKFTMPEGGAKTITYLNDQGGQDGNSGNNNGPGF